MAMTNHTPVPTWITTTVVEGFSLFLAFDATSYLEVTGGNYSPIFSEFYVTEIYFGEFRIRPSQALFSYSRSKHHTSHDEMLDFQ